MSFKDHISAGNYTYIFESVQNKYGI